MSVEKINGTPRNHAKALSMWVRPRAYTNRTPYKQEKDINVSTTVCVHNGTLYKQDKETSMWVRPRAYTTRRHDGDNHMINGRTRQSSSADVNNNHLLSFRNIWILSNIPTLIDIVPACRLRKICLPDCNVLVVIRVFDHSERL